jgi:hypothetical protein
MSVIGRWCFECPTSLLQVTMQKTHRSRRTLGRREADMPIEFHFKPDSNLVICVHVGTIHDDEFFASYKELFESERFNTSLNLLIDLRQTDSTQRSTDALYQFADLTQEHYIVTSSHPKVAVVAPSPLSFGLARMYDALADLVPWDFMVFNDIDGALAWLGVPDKLMDALDKDAQHRIEHDFIQIALRCCLHGAAHS